MLKWLLSLFMWTPLAHGDYKIAVGDFQALKIRQLSTGREFLLCFEVSRRSMSVIKPDVSFWYVPVKSAISEREQSEIMEALRRFCCANYYTLILVDGESGGKNGAERAGKSGS